MLADHSKRNPPVVEAVRGSVAFMLMAASLWAAAIDGAMAEGELKPSADSDIAYLKTQAWAEDLAGPLCGVYAASTALQIVGLDADPRNFIAARYVSNCGGSTPEEVARMVRDAGGQARILKHLSALDLRLMNCPLIANVRMSPVSNRFNHWVVALPQGREVTIYDGLQEPYRVQVAEFLGVWSGVGVCVTSGEADPLVTIWLGRGSLLLAGGLAAAVAWRGGRQSSWFHRLGASKQSAGLLVMATVLSLLGNFAFGDLLNHQRGVAIATVSSQPVRYRQGTLADARRASKDPDALLVDARRVEDYRLGTIENAVNVPVTASTWSIKDYLERVDRSTPVVVFCQSARCGYDETVASQLSSLGFADVTVCDQGWAEYRIESAVADK